MKPIAIIDTRARTCPAHRRTDDAEHFCTRPTGHEGDCLWSVGSPVHHFATIRIVHAERAEPITSLHGCTDGGARL